MTWDAWERAKSDVAQRNATQTRLNQLPAESGGGGTEDLVVHDDQLGRLGGADRRLHGNGSQPGYRYR